MVANPSIRGQALLKGAITQFSQLGMVRKSEERTIIVGNTAKITGTFINYEEGVRILYELSWDAKPKAIYLAHEVDTSVCLWLRFSYRSVRSGYRSCRGYRIYDKTKTYGAATQAGVAARYNETKKAGEEFRLRREILDNSPLTPYGFTAPQFTQQADGVYLQHLLNACCVMDAVSVKDGKIDRDVEKPNNGEPFFIVCCTSCTGREFWIVTDGEIFHPTSKINHALWLNKTHNPVVLRHFTEGVDLKLATPVDRALITAAIEEFLK